MNASLNSPRATAITPAQAGEDGCSDTPRSDASHDWHAAEHAGLVQSISGAQPGANEELRYRASMAAAKTGATLLAVFAVLGALQLANHPSFLLVAVLGMLGGAAGYAAGCFFSRGGVGKRVSVNLALWTLSACLGWIVVKVFVQ